MNIEMPNPGVTVMIDAASIDVWNRHAWRIAPNGREVVATVDGVPQRLHRVLMSAPPDLEVDHINGNPLDNRLENLRLCTHAENMRNRKMHKNNRLGLKGVYVDNRPNSAKPFRAQIRVAGKKHFLGAFSTAVEASKAYSVAAKIHHGEFARNL